MNCMSIKNIVLGLCVLLIALSCRKENASWNSDWVVPIVKDSLSIKDYVNDSTLAVNADQSIQVIANRRLIDLDLSELIEIPDTTVVQSFVVDFPLLEIAPGTSFLDEIKEHDFAFDETALTEARIETGIATIQIENPVDVDGLFEISLPGVTRNGVVFTHSETVSAGTAANPGIGSLVLNLAGYNIDLTGESGQIYNALQSRMKVSTDANGPAVTITNQDVFKTKVEFKNLKVDYAKGYFGNLLFSDTTTLDIDVFSKITGGTLNLEDLNLSLIIKNGIKARAQGEVTLFESTNTNNNVVALAHPMFGQKFNIQPASGAWSSLQASEKPFLFDATSGNLEAFLENLGSQYEIGYGIELNPLGNTSSGNDVIYPQSRLGIDLEADFPLKLGANDLTLRDTFDFDFENDEKLLQVISGELLLKTINSFPYGASVEMEMLDESLNTVAQFQSNGQITPAQMNISNDGHEPVEDELTFTINKELGSKLNEVKSIVITAKFNSTTFSNNKVYANAALELLLMSSLKLKSEL